MATFNAKSFEKKLRSLESTQTSIQTLSLWILHHRNHGEQIANAWLEQLVKASKAEKKLCLFYLVNDVVQNGRRKAKSLVTAFGGVLLEALPLLRNPKIKPQVERVFKIWLERSVYDMELINAFKLKIDPPSKPVKTPTTSVVAKEKAVAPRKKAVPINFKVANLLVSIKKATNYDNDVERKSVALEKLKIDASSFDSVKHVKDRSSVGRFHKQFEESKILLDDYIQTLKRCQRDKMTLMALLTGGETFYEVAQEEAKVIVNAYKTFGNRLNSMKKKLDAKIRRMDEERAAESSQSEDTILDDGADRRAISSGSISPGEDSNNIQDMDLDSDADIDGPDDSSEHNPLSTPTHDQSDQLSSQASPVVSSVDSQEDFYSNYENVNFQEGLDEQFAFELTPVKHEEQHQDTISQSPEKSSVSSINTFQQDALNMIGLAKQIQSDVSSQPVPNSVDQEPHFQQPQLITQAFPTLKMAGLSVSQQQIELPGQQHTLSVAGIPETPLSQQQQTLSMSGIPERSLPQQQQQALPMIGIAETSLSQQQHQQHQQQRQRTPSPLGQSAMESELETQSYLSSPTHDISSFFDLPPLELNLGKESLNMLDNCGSNEEAYDMHTMDMMKNLPDNAVSTPDGLVIAEETVIRSSVDNITSYGMTQVTASSAAVSQLQNFQVISSSAISSSGDFSQDQVHLGMTSSYMVNSNIPTPVQDEKDKLSHENLSSLSEIPKNQQPLQSLIDSLFPVLSKSLQTIKEKQQAAEEGAKPTISDAMAFALGSPSTAQEVPRKKGRFVTDVSPAPVVSPLSLTNPKGLSENQTELISIAAGLTKFDENFLPVSKEENVTPPSEELASTQQPPAESIENEKCDNEVVKPKEKEKENEENEKKREENEKKREESEKKREDRKSRHGSSRHRSSHKDDDRRKSSSSPSRRPSHRDDDRHKRSLSRSPSRRSSHRSSRESRDDRHSDRRKSSRRSQSPRRRRGNRGRRSLSRDREDSRRRRSPDSKRAPYYNDRRSPTPEMDSSAHPPQFTQNIMTTPIVNQIFHPIPGISNQTTSSIGEPNLDSPSGTSFLNSGVLMSSSLYPASDDPGLPVTESDILQSNESTNDDDDSLSSGKPGDGSAVIQVSNHIRPGTMQIDQSSIGGSVVNPMMNYDNNGRPLLLSGIQLRPPNSIQILQQRSDLQQPNILHLRPLPPGLISINTGQNIIGSMSAPLVMQNDISQKPIEHSESAVEYSTSLNNKGDNSNQETPILPNSDDSGVVSHEDAQSKPSNSEAQSIQNNTNIPEQSFQERPPFALFPLPPPFFPNDLRPPEDSSKIFAPGGVGNVANTHIDEPAEPNGGRDGEPHFSGPRPQLDVPRGPCFEGPRGPRFDGPKEPIFDGSRGPRFDGPREPRFDAPREPRFDGPRGPRFDIPREQRFDGPRGPRFEGPRGPRFDAPRGPRFDVPRGPRFDCPRGPRFDSPRGPRFDGPRGPRFDGPIFEGPMGPRFDGPREPRFDGPREPRFDGPREPRFDGPRGPRFDGPRGPRFDEPLGPRFDGPRRDHFDPPNSFHFDGQRGGRFRPPMRGRLDMHRGGRFDGPRHFQERLHNDGDEEMRNDGPDARFDEHPRDLDFERPKDPLFDELEKRKPKCAEPDPLLDQLEAQQNLLIHSHEKQSHQESQPPQPPPQEHRPNIEDHEAPNRSKFKPAFSEVRPFDEPRPFDGPRFRPVFNTPTPIRFRPRFERRPFRPFRPFRPRL